MMSDKALAVYLGEQRVGTLTHHSTNKNVFVFDEGYISLGPRRLVLSLSFTTPASELKNLAKLQKPYLATESLPPFFGNLLPEGSYRTWVQAQAGIKDRDEFALLQALRHDLPGNILLEPISGISGVEHLDQETEESATVSDGIKFSLAGVQFKFSMMQHGDRYTLTKQDEIGDYIVKTPSSIHPLVPQHEYSSMKLAEAVGVEISEIELVPLSHLGPIRHLELPDEPSALVVKRFDRNADGSRIHIEDFAQVFSVRSQRKYQATNYDSMGRLMLNIFNKGKATLEQFLRRLFVDILLGNTDAHLKNFSVIYRDGISPDLAPAYDIVSSLSYIDNREMGLNFARKKVFYDIDIEVVKRFARRVGADEEWVVAVLENVIAKAREAWPSLFLELPMSEEFKKGLKDHFGKLNEPFNQLLDM